MPQLTLIPDPKPLDGRLGREFFLDAPRKPGVYLMRNELDVVVYVGKAKNLRQRLSSYRLANPDRMARRHLRMVREVKRIEFQICRDESEAIKREAKLLLELRPKFNRAGVWPGKTKFIAWRGIDSQVQMTVAEVPDMGWLRCGPLRGSALYVQQSLARVLWLALNPSRNISEIPAGWMKGEPLQSIALDCGITFQETMSSIESLLLGDGTGFFTWLDERLNPRSNPFERNVIAAELEVLAKFLEKRRTASGETGQMAML